MLIHRTIRWAHKKMRVPQAYQYNKILLSHKQLIILFLGIYICRIIVQIKGVINAKNISYFNIVNNYVN